MLYSSGVDETSLSYDTECSSTMSWHHDEPDGPTETTLCPETCESIRTDPAAQVSLECEDVIVLI